MRLIYDACGQKTALNLDLVTLISVDRETVYFCGVGPSDENGNATAAVIETLIFETEQIANTCFSEIMERIEAGEILHRLTYNFTTSEEPGEAAESSGARAQ